MTDYDRILLLGQTPLTEARIEQGITRLAAAWVANAERGQRYLPDFARTLFPSSFFGLLAPSEY